MVIEIVGEDDDSENGNTDDDNGECFLRMNRRFLNEICEN